MTAKSRSPARQSAGRERYVSVPHDTQLRALDAMRAHAGVHSLHLRGVMLVTDSVQLLIEADARERDPLELVLAAEERFGQIKRGVLEMDHRERLVLVAHGCDARSLAWIARSRSALAKREAHWRENAFGSTELPTGGSAASPGRLNAAGG